MSCCHLLEEFALRFWELRDLGDTIGLWLGFFPVKFIRRIAEFYQTELP